MNPNSFPGAFVIKWTIPYPGIRNRFWARFAPSVSLYRKYIQYLTAREEQTAQHRCLSRTYHFTIRSLPEYGKYEDSADICDDDIDAESEGDKGDDGEEGQAAIFTLPFSVNGVESSVLADITMRLQVYYIRA